MDKWDEVVHGMNTISHSVNMVKLEPTINLTDTQNGSHQSTCDQDSETINLEPVPLTKTYKVGLLDELLLNNTKVLMKKTKSDKSQLVVSNVEAVVDMICQSLVEPDVVEKILNPLVPMDVMNLDLALPGLASILWPQSHTEVRFDFVKWRKSEESTIEFGLEELVDCDIDDEGGFVRVRLDGSHVTAYDVSEKWIALGYYSGAIRLFDRKKLSFNKLIYDGKKDVDRYSGKISHVWIHEDTVITIDTRNTLVIRTVDNLDKPVKHVLGDSLEHLVVQKNVCLQVFVNQENYDLFVYEVIGSNMIVIKQLSIPKIVTSNIIKVSLNTDGKQLLLYYEEEMMDYKTWKNVELFGDQLSLQFQQFYTTFTGHQRPTCRMSNSIGQQRRTHFLVIIQYESGLVLDQYKINPDNLVLGPCSSFRVLSKVGDGTEKNLWKLLSPSIEILPYDEYGGYYIPNQIDDICDTSFSILKGPIHLLQNVLDVDSKMQTTQNNDQRTIKCKLVSKNVFYDQRSLIYHAENEDHTDVTILDLWKGDWNTEALYKPIQWRKIPDLVESSEESDTVDSDEETESDTDSEDVDYLVNIHAEWGHNAPNEVAHFDAVSNEDEDVDVLVDQHDNADLDKEQNDNATNEESEDEMPSLETGTGL